MREPLTQFTAHSELYYLQRLMRNQRHKVLQLRNAVVGPSHTYATGSRNESPKKGGRISVMRPPFSPISDLRS